MIVNGYEMQTTFWQDFSIADRFGIDAIKDTHSRSEIMKEALEKMTKEYENRKFKSASK